MKADRSALAELYRDHVAVLGRGYALALAETGWDGAVIHSGSQKIRCVFDDQYWPLRVTPHFQHWLPLAVPDCALLVMAQAPVPPTLFHNTQRSFWEGTISPESDHFWAHFQVVEVSEPEKVKDLLPRGARLAFFGEDAARGLSWGQGASVHNPSDLVKRLDRLRTIKSGYEEACISEANRRAAEGHRRVAEAFLTGDHSELQLHLMYLEATGQDDPETPYKNIVAMGRNAATLHHVHYGRRAGGARSLLLDAGATFLGYASDITRTVVKGNGEAVDVFRDLVARMDTLQQEAGRRVHVGLPYEQLHDQSHELLAEILRDLGIARGSGDELVASGATRRFFPHGLGHSLGLQCHDVGCAVVRPRPENPFLRNTSTIHEGQVFTIEPGCYFIDSQLEALRSSAAGSLINWKLVAALAPLGGVRIEDNLAVGQETARNLTREFLGTIS
ncbi:MAG: Xaa-Pro dipeptidase [Deltaproteobacteria bacterium]|nr:Xaa-Pro dipeptidase [Deltaproteobacteria bacterium]